MSTNLVLGHCHPINSYTIAIDPQELFKQIKPPKKVAVATGCPLCDKIWSSAEAYKWLSDENDEWYGIAIVMADDKPWLYTLVDNWYVMQINHCPKCGRRLIKE